jgi:hypothetical protein
MKHKLEKYINKLNKLQSIYFYFNTYGKSIPEKYTKLLKLIKSDFLHIKEANTKQYRLLREGKDILCKNDYYAKLKFDIGSVNTIFTLFVLSNYSITSVINIIITNENKCYIETICGFTNNVLLNTLKEISKKYGISAINTFSIYQLETDFLLQNGFNKNKNNELEYVL